MAQDDMDAIFAEMRGHQPNAGDPFGAASAAADDPFTGDPEQVVARAEPPGAKGFFETIGDTGVERVPFLGTAKEFSDMAGLLNMARRAESGRASQRDLQILNNWVAEQDRGHTIMGGAANIMLSIPKFAIELLASAGAGKAAVVVGKGAAKEGLRAAIRGLARNGALSATKKRTIEVVGKKYARDLARKTAARKITKGMGGAAMAKGLGVNAARGVVQVGGIVASMEALGQATGKLVGIEDSGGIISAGAANNALGKIQWEQDEFGRFQVAMDQAIPGTLDALPQGFVDAMIEVGTEFSGGVLAKGARGAFAKATAKYGIEEIPVITMLQGVQMRAAEKWLGKGGKNTMGKLLAIAEKGKFNGILGEYLEERLGDVSRGVAGAVPGWEDDFDGTFPGLADTISELIAFSAIPAGAAGVGAVQELQIRRKEAGMSREEILQTRAERAAREAAASGEGRADGELVVGSIRGRVRRHVENLVRSDYLEFERSYNQPGGARLAQELEELATDKQILAGNAYGSDYYDIGFGVFGQDGRVDADPVSVATIMEEMVTALGGGIDFVPGREANIETDKKRGRRFGSVAKGVDAAGKLIGLEKSKNIGEMVEKLGAVFETRYLRPQNIDQKEDESDKEFDLRQIKATFRVGGSAGMSQEALDEIQALGSIAEQGMGDAARRKLKRARRLLEKGGPQRLKELVKELEAEIEDVELQHFQIGFQNFFRLQTTADGSSIMPNASAWWNDVFKARNPVRWEKIQGLTDTIKRFRTQGAHARAEVQRSDMNAPAKVWQKRIEMVTTPAGRSALKQLFKEELIGAEFATASFTARMRALKEAVGERLKTGENLFLLDQILPGMAAATRDLFAFDKIVDWRRNTREGIKPLSAAGVIIEGRVESFGEYLRSRRAIALWEDKAALYDEEGNLLKVGGTGNSRKTSRESIRREAGIGVEDARIIVDQAPEGFEEASEIVYAWWEAVIDFLAESSEHGKEIAGRMRRRDPGDFVGLTRELKEVESVLKDAGSITQDALGVNVTKDLEGSMELVGPIWESMISMSGKMFDLAFELKRIEVIYQATQVAGMEDMVRILSPDEVEVARPKIKQLIGSAQKALQERAWAEQAAAAREAGEIPPPREDIGMELFGVVAGNAERHIDDIDEFFETEVPILKDSPTPEKGDNRRIIPVKDPQGRTVYMEILNPELMRWFNGRMAPEKINIGLQALALHKKVFTFSTTTGRLLFQWFRNPVRDIGTAIINTRTNGTALRYMKESLGAIGAEFKRALTGGNAVDEHQELFMRLGLEWSTELAADSFAGRSLVRRLSGQNKGKFKGAWEFTLDMLQAPERGVRTTELKLYAKEMQAAGKLDTLENLTEENMLDLVLAAKQVSTNFTVSGRTAGKINRFIPFFNAQIQGPRDTFRAIMAEGNPERRSEKLMRAFMFYTVPALIAWWYVKDEDWYIELTPQEKAGSWFIGVGGGEHLVMPLPFEIGTIFSAMPVTFVDAAYRENPAETDWFVARLVGAAIQSGAFAGDAMPNAIPPSMRAMYDVLANEKSYWGTPIVSDTLLRLEEKAQYDEFTTHLARWIGSSAGELGINDGSGWSPKVIEHMVKGLTGPLGLDMMEAVSGTDAKDIGGFRSLPIVGRQFKEDLGYPKSVTELYERYNKVQQRFDTKLGDESEDEMNVRLAMRDAIKAVSSINLMLRQATGELRDGLKVERLSIARKGLAIYAAKKIDPEEKKVLRARRKELDAEKKAIKAEIVRKRQESLGG